uniref:NADH-ubiquinone oxidoreductase chain 6 n=1 Tax=Glossosoma caudatum TaxID=2904899 RepID=A0A9E8RSH9_9NEOP|nr:NADH dehydrogenase subunit 6 [Glossosoma caudatum]UZZ43633.1 NADH dehydrogenase subunit 6 [Glossosoma caudatum]
MINLLNFSIISLTLMMLFIKHPLMMGLIILIQTLLISLICGFMMPSFWFSYILFLVFLGGLLVIFIYISTLISNKMFKFSYKLMLFSLISLVLFLINKYYMNQINNLEMLEFYEHMGYMEKTLNLSKLYNNYSFKLTMMMIIYLFITLIAVVMINNIKYGPLRKIN